MSLTDSRSLAVLSSVKFSGRRIMMWERFSGVGLSPLFAVKGTLNASDDFMLPALWEHFGDGSFLFQHDCDPTSTQTWMRKFDGKEHD